jgi:tRNA pseudouridine55 synthase
LAQAVPLAQVQAAPGEVKLVGVDEALGDMPALQVTAAQAEKVGHGGLVEVPAREGVFRVLGPTGRLLAVAEVARGRLTYKRVFR